MGQNAARSRPTFHPTRTPLLALALALLIAADPAWSQTIRYYHADITGSVVAVTDEQGNVVERRQYEPYGLPQSAIPDGPGYTGHDMDGESGLIYMQQRYYDPEVGRFISTDPMAVDPTTAWNFNRYNYAAANPYKYRDPDGRESGCIHATSCGDFSGVNAQSAGVILDFTPVLGDVKGIAEAFIDASAINIAVAVVGIVPGAGDAAAKIIKGAAGGGRAQVVEAGGKRFSKEKEALVDMAQSDAKTGVTRSDMDAYKELNAELPDPFPDRKIRIDEGHARGAAHSQLPHGHVGPVDHIPINDEKLR